MRSLRTTFRSILWIPETPERTALAFALGVFWGFCPFLGFHTVLALAAALILRLNKLATLAGVWINVPWLLPLYYGFATWFGVQLTGLPEGISLPTLGITELMSSAFWNWLIAQWPLLYPAFVGSTVLSVAMSLLAYPLALRSIRLIRSLEHPSASVGSHTTEQKPPDSTPTTTDPRLQDPGTVCRQKDGMEG